MSREINLPSELFKLSVDHDLKLISMRLKGSEASAYYVDRMLAGYDGIDAPCLYDWLLDYRQFSGIIEGQDVERLAQHWRDLADGQSAGSKIAVVTDDVLTPARANAFRHLFPKDEIRTFHDLNTALVWLKHIDVGR